MAKKGGTYLSKEVVITPKGNYIIPSLEAFKEQKAADSREFAAKHIQYQHGPNIPLIPSRAPWSWIAGKIMGMSDKERIRRFGTADVQTCIYTATSQYRDKYARVSGNKTFRENPEKFGFYEVPMDSAKVGDLIQLTDFTGTPHHSTILTGKNKAGDLFVSYSNGSTQPYEVFEGDTIWTMKKNMPIEIFGSGDDPIDDTPAAFRYVGSPGKQQEWTDEYIKEYGLRKEDYFKTPTIPTYTEQPDALRVQKPLIKAEGGFLKPKDAWDKLSMREKAEMIRVGVQNGLLNLQDIRKKYNEYADGGSTDTDWSYNSWKRQVAEHMGIRLDEDNTYDYEAYFNKYPEEAWKMLKGDPTAHFSDEFKTVYHPTFSSKSIGNDGSIYSGVRNPKTNPQGLVGGTWSPDYKTFTMSPDGYRGPVSMDDRKWYLENAEDNGVQFREADGSLPVYDGIPWGGVLPNVTVYGNKHVEGGNLFGGGGNTVVTDDLVDWTIREEGFNRQPEDIGDGKMTLGSGLTAKRWHNLYKKRGNKWSDADNRMAVRQELSEREAWARNNVPNWESLPDSSKEALLLYKYNYDFNQANSPKLFAALAAGNLQEAARQMDATSKDPKFRKGLMDRRKREQEHFLLGVNPTPSLPVQASRRDITVEYPVSTSVFNPFAIQASNTQMMPMMVPDEGSYVTTHEVSPSEQRAESIKNRFDAINRFNVLMDLISPQNNPVPEFMPTTGNSFLDALGLFANSNAKGGKIHKITTGD